MKPTEKKASRPVFVLVMFIAPAFAQTGTWTPPVALSTGGQGWEAAAAIDGGGNSLALWDERTAQDHLWSRSKPPDGAWGSVSQVSHALQTTSVFPALRVTPTGFATAVWSDSDGVWTADRPAAAKWNPAQLLVSGASVPIFVMNSRGDAAVVWTDGGATDFHSTVMAVLRRAGGAWSSPQTVASGVHITTDHAGIGENGAVIVTWESYTAVCSEGFCELSNFVLHAARANPATSSWSDSGVLLGPDDDSHDARVAFDSAGNAMLVGQAGTGAYISSTQSASGGAWSPFNTVADPQSISIVSDMLSDNSGSVTFVYEVIGFSTSQAVAVNGAMRNNAWAPPAVVSGSDASVGQIYFSLAPSGAALLAWLESSAVPVIHTIVRAAALGSWSSPVAVSETGSTEIGPEAAAVNSAGQAVVIYSGYNPADVHTEYATHYQP